MDEESKMPTKLYDVELKEDSQTDIEAFTQADVHIFMFVNPNSGGFKAMEYINLNQETLQYTIVTQLVAVHIVNLFDE